MLMFALSTQGPVMSNQLKVVHGDFDPLILDRRNPQSHRKRQIRQIDDIIPAFDLNVPSATKLVEERDLSRGKAHMPSGVDEENAVPSMAKSIWLKQRFQRLLGTRITAARLNPRHEAYDESYRLPAFLEMLEIASRPESSISHTRG